MKERIYLTKPKLRGKILSEFFGSLNANTKERIFFVKLDTGQVLDCLVPDELRNTRIRKGDRVLLGFTNRETAIIWPMWYFCIVKIINN